MALFNEIQAGRYNRFVQKLLGIKGRPPMPTVSSDLTFQHVIKSGAETWYLEGWDDFFRQKTVAGLAANLSTFELRNPPASNVVAVVTRAAVQMGGTADTATLFFAVGATADQASINQARSFDTRGRPQATSIISDNNGSGLTAIGGTAAPYIGRVMAINGALEFLYAGEEIELLPGNALYLQTLTAAISFTPVFRWRERFLEDSERF